MLVRADALDRGDRCAIGLRGEDGAALDRLAVQVNGAGAARARVAADMRAGQSQRLAKKMDEQLAGLDLGVVLDPVDRDINRNDTLRYRC